jgi:4'-phosphopantetheinyl transferase
MSNDLTSAEWFPAPLKIGLEADEVHVWRASLDCNPAELSRLKASLSPDELTRAARFVSEKDQHHFTAARGILRELVGAYLEVPPDQITFRYGSNGKPELDHQSLPLQFNLSHASGFAVYGFSLERQIGIDVELLRPQNAAEDIAARYFAAGEIAELRKLDPELRTEGFFCCWTRKEAYVKAHGSGLSIPLDSFAVSLTPSQPTELHSSDRARWSMRTFKPWPGCIAAIVVEQPTKTMRFWNWGT